MKKSFAAVLGLALLFASATAFAGEWTGTIMNKDGKLWFQTGSKNYSITNPDKVKSFEGKIVKITGTKDAATNSLTVQTVA